MNSDTHESRDRVAQPRPAGRLRLRLRRNRPRLYGPFDPLFRSLRAPTSRPSVDERRTWVRGRPLVRIVKVASVVGGIILLAAVIRSLYVVIAGKPSSFLAVNVDAACRNTSFSCDILAGTLGPLFSLAFASALFLLVRLWLVHRPYVRRARDEPQQVVETAGSIISEVAPRKHSIRSS